MSEEFAETAVLWAIAKSHIRLVAGLAARGVITSEEVEALRTAFMADLDVFQTTQGLAADAAEAIERCREMLDDNWDQARHQD